MRIGVDIGGVLMDNSKDNSPFFTDDFLSTPAVPHALTSLRRLAKSHEVFIISKVARPRNVEKTLAWLEDRALLTKAGVDPNRLVFCRKLWEKAPIAALLELDVFIDDRADICESMRKEGITAIQFTDWDSAFEELAKITEL